MPGYLRASLNDFQHEKPKRLQESPCHWTQHVYGNNNQILSEKAPDEELDEHDPKRLQKIVGKLLYNARSIDPKVLMTLNSLAAGADKSDN